MVREVREGENMSWTIGIFSNSLLKYLKKDGRCIHYRWISGIFLRCFIDCGDGFMWDGLVWHTCEILIYAEGPTDLGHYSDVIMRAIASQLTGVSIVYSVVCSGTDKRKQQSFASLAFMRRIHQSPVNSPHKGPVTRKMFPFDDVAMETALVCALLDFGRVKTNMVTGLDAK